PPAPRRTGRSRRGGRRPYPFHHRARIRASSPRLPIAVVLVLLGLVIAALGYQHATGTSLVPSALLPAIRTPPPKFPVLDPSPPVGIAIKSVQLQAPVTSTGLAPDGTIAPPPPERWNEAGWYDQSPTPGQYGPAVIVGHVDTRTGPAVFHELSRVRPGDRVEVSRADGSVAIFEVDNLKRYDKSQLPPDEVFGDFHRPNLRLITCGGRWVGGHLGYADNVVVFASLVNAHR
ncbi:class F sortase, partial [Micromonospora zhanjiangensis]